MPCNSVAEEEDEINYEEINTKVESKEEAWALGKEDVAIAELQTTIEHEEVATAVEVVEVSFET